MNHKWVWNVAPALGEWDNQNCECVKVGKGLSWLVLFESGCFEMFESGCLARVIWKWMFEMFERTNWNWKSWPQSAICFWSHVYRILRSWQISSNIQHIFLYDAKIFVVMWSKVVKEIHESRVCLSGASAYQQVHFQRIQRIKVHGCFLHPDKVKLLCLRNLILTEMFRGREMMIKHFGLYLGTP